MKKFLKITTLLCTIILGFSNGVFAVEINNISNNESYEKLNEYAEEIKTFDNFVTEDTEFIVQTRGSDKLEKIKFNELHEKNKLKYKKILTKTEYYRPNIKENIRDDFFNTQLSNEDPSTSLFRRLSPKEYRLCRLTINGGLNSGSGFLVGPKLLLTAAHCIYDDNNNIMPVIFYPAYDNGSSHNGKSSGWQKIYTYPSWHEDHEKNRQYDLALIELDWNMGDEFGWFGSQSYGTNQEMNNLLIKEYGFPKLVGNAEEQYYTQGSISTTYDTYFYTSAVNYKGMSGGPIVRTSDNYAVGLISGLIRNKNIFGNVTSFETYGRRITQDIIDLINSYN